MNVPAPVRKLLFTLALAASLSVLAPCAALADECDGEANPPQAQEAALMSGEADALETPNADPVPETPVAAEEDAEPFAGETPDEPGQEPGDPSENGTGNEDAQVASIEAGAPSDDAPQVEPASDANGIPDPIVPAVASAATSPDDPGNAGSTGDTGDADDPENPEDPDDPQEPEEPEPEPIEIASVAASVPNAIYTGKAIKPQLVLTYDKTALKAGIDYRIVSWKNNVKVGTASVVVRGMGDFTGLRTLAFKIFGKPSCTRGATEMPIASTSKWTFANATLKRTSGSSISISKGTVTARKKGASTLTLYNLLGKAVRTYEVQVVPLNGIYVINSALGKGKVIDIGGASKKNGGNAQLYKRNGTQAQAYRFSRSGDAYVIVNVNSKKALDVREGSRKNGANVQQWAKNGTGAQKWRIQVDKSNRLTFINVKSGKVLDVRGASTKNGANVQQWKSNGTTAQKWKLSVAPVKYSFGASKVPVAATAKWTVVNGKLAVLSGKAVTVKGSTVVGAKAGTSEVAILNSVGEKVASRKVTVYRLDQKTYTIDSALGRSLVLDVSVGSKDNGANVQLYSRNRSMAQAFRFTRSGDAYIIANANSGRVLDVVERSKRNGANVQQWGFNNTGAQKWRIQVDKHNQLMFTNVASGKALDVANGQAKREANVQQYSKNGSTAQKWTLTATGVVYKPGDYLAAAAVALAGYGGKKSPKAPGYYTRPPDVGRGGDWTVYNMVYDAMSGDMPEKRYTDCAANVALAVLWSGIDDDYPRSSWVNVQHAYLVSSSKWKQVGTTTYKHGELQQKITLKPGDLLVHPNGDGTYSHIGIYTGTQANDLKYPDQGFDYYQAARGMKKWTHTLKFSKAEYDWYEWEVFRMVGKADPYSAMYSLIYPEEQKKYLVNG